MQEVKNTMRTVALWSTASVIGATVIWSVAHFMGKR